MYLDALKKKFHSTTNNKLLLRKPVVLNIFKWGANSFSVLDDFAVMVIFIQTWLIVLFNKNGAEEKTTNNKNPDTKAKNLFRSVSDST